MQEGVGSTKLPTFNRWKHQIKKKNTGTIQPVKIWNLEPRTPKALKKNCWGVIATSWCFFPLYFCCGCWIWLRDFERRYPMPYYSWTKNHPAVFTWFTIGIWTLSAGKFLRISGCFNRYPPKVNTHISCRTNLTSSSEKTAFLREKKMLSSFDSPEVFFQMVGVVNQVKLHWSMFYTFTNLHFPFHHEVHSSHPCIKICSTVLKPN